MMTVGERVRRLRKDNDIGQEELARRIKVTGQTISRLERGDTKEPDMATLRGIAEVFGVTVDFLLTGEAQEVSENFGATRAPSGETYGARAADKGTVYGIEGGGSEADGIRSQAVLNLIKDPALDVQREEFDVLEDLADRLAAYKGLAEVQKMLRVLFLAYRADPGGFDQTPGVSSTFTYGSQTEAGEAETRAAQERNAAKGHMPLKKPAKRS
jgi:transcriptional regulator with XRE-family HTH domain